jgi:hypothetical protein
MDTYLVIGNWAEFTPKGYNKPLQGKILSVNGVVATLDVLSDAPLQHPVIMTKLTSIRQPKPTQELPDHLLNEAERRSLLPKEEQEPWEREMHDYFDNMTPEQFEGFLEETNYEFYSKIRHPVFSEAVIAYPIILGKKKDITGRIIDGDDWQPSSVGDGLRGEKRGKYWCVTTPEKATHVYVKHFYPSFCENLPPGGSGNCPMLLVEILPAVKTP